MTNRFEPKILITSKRFRYADLILYGEKTRLEKGKRRVE